MPGPTNRHVNYEALHALSCVEPPRTPSCKPYAFHMVIILDFPDFQGFFLSQVLLIKKWTSFVVAFRVAK